MQSRSASATEVLLTSDSPSAPWRAVFEDDGESAYFYACTSAGSSLEILDALQIRAVPATAVDSPQLARIVWSTDGLKAGLIIGNEAHAVIDFARRKGFCRSNFPPSSSVWGSREPWTDRALDLLF